MSALQWNALDYEKNSSQQQLWARELIAKLNLRGDLAVPQNRFAERDQPGHQWAFGGITPIQLLGPGPVLGLVEMQLQAGFGGQPTSENDHCQAYHNQEKPVQPGDLMLDYC